MSRLFVDANIPMYAAGVGHPLVEPSRRVIAAVAAGDVEAVTDAEVLQEILYRYLKINQRNKGFEVFDNFRQIMLGQILGVEDDDVANARFLAERYPALGPRDLLHTAIMTRHGVETMVSADTDFDLVAEVRRIDPAAFRAGQP